MNIRKLKKEVRDTQAARPRRRAKPVLAALSLPEDVSEDGVRVILLGSGRALVENMLGVADVGREEIRLAARAGILTFRGRGLMLTDVREGALAVNGEIESVHLPGDFPEAAHE